MVEIFKCWCNLWTAPQLLITKNKLFVKSNTFCVHNFVIIISFNWCKCSRVVYCIMAVSDGESENQ